MPGAVDVTTPYMKASVEWRRVQERMNESFCMRLDKVSSVFYQVNLILVNLAAAL